MKIRTAILTVLLVVGTASLASADPVQVRFLDANGQAIEGQGATKVDGVGVPMLKIPALAPDHTVYTIDATTGEKVSFVVENPASVLTTYELEIPVDISGIIDISVASNPAGAGAPGNDECSGAIPVAVPSITGGTTIDASTDVASPACGTSTITSPGVWYSFVGTGLTVTASVCNAADFDTKISVFCKGCAVQTCVGGFDDYAGCAGFTSQVTVPTQAGIEYLVLVHGFGGATGNFNLSLSEGAAPDFGPVDCSPVGACCDCNAFPFNCTEGTAGDCAQRGGQFDPTNSSCVSANNDYESYDGPDGLPISNDLDPTVAVVNVPDSYVVADVNVEIALDHTWVGDLVIDIEHAGVTRILWNAVCGSTDNLNATFDDDGTETFCAPINAGPSNSVFVSPALSGDGPLAVFNNMDSFGEWTLTIDDGFGGDDGTLNAWTLHLDSGTPTCPDYTGFNCFICDWSSLSNGNPGGRGDDDDDDDDNFESTFRNVDEHRSGGMDVMERGDN